MGRGSLGRLLEARRVAPQPLEGVEAALFFHEHVHHEVDVVQKDPLPLAPSLHVVRFEVQLTAQALFHRLRDGEDLTVRASVADDEVVGDVAQAPEVQDDNLLGLPVPRGLDAAGEFRSQRLPSCRYSPCV